MKQNPSLPPLPLVSLNHVSFLCSSLHDSIKFYQEVLGFELVKRPSSLGFEGAWLYKYGVGVHLLLRDSPATTEPKSRKIDPKDNHISFQVSDTRITRRILEEKKIEYVSGVVREGELEVEQLFFHDPDHNMIEICDCQNIPVIPL
ncbi:metallothiol transferase FosB-like [Zingiber officinale]|uniref:metallothiol transferase FosB-like n=1 Tax=Zingiber officinale TaxID=94328 RepID=UPI001C4DCB14|nr:metallothiol transferase FosB-like [Zingiber officinale]